MDTILNTLEGWGNGLLENIPNIVAALLVLMISFVIGRFVRQAVHKIMSKGSGTPTVISLVSTLSYIASIITGTVVALNILDLGGAATSLLAGAGVVGIAIGFAFQDIAANFIAGVFIAFQKPMKVGDLVETNEYYGRVKKISLRMTEIETLQGQRVYIPNKDIILNPLVEFNALKDRRIDMNVGVGYNDDLEEAQKLAIDAVSKLDSTNLDKPIDLYYTEFGDSSINFTIRFWTNFKDEIDYLGARSNAIIAIKKSFDKQGVSIPFPITTLDGAVKIKK